MKRALLVLSVCLVLVAMITTVQAQDFTPLSSNLIANEFNSIGFDGAGNAYLFTTYGVKDYDGGLVAARDFIATPGQSYEGAYLAGYTEDDGFLIADGDVGVTFVDTWDPDVLYLTATLDLGGTCRHVAGYSQDSVYVLCAVDGVGIVAVDVVDNTNPLVYGTYSDPDLYVNEMIWRDTLLYVSADTTGFLIFDVGDLENPTFLSEWDYTGVTFRGFDLHPIDDSAYVAVGGPGVVVIDVSDPSTPTPMLPPISTGAPALDVAYFRYFAGASYYNYFIVAEGTNGFEIYRDIAAGSPTGTATTAGPCNSVMTINYGIMAYTFEGIAGMESWNVYGAWNPTLIASLVEPGGARAVAIDGNYAYVANYTAGMTVLDLTDPANPDSLTTTAAEVECWDVLVNGNYAYALEYGAQVPGGLLFVYDITDPANPVQGTAASTPAGLRSVDVSGDYLYIGSYNGEGVHVVDISSPMVPVVGTAVTVASDVEGVTVDSDRLYVAANDGGVLVYGLTDPSAPNYLGEYVTNGNAKMVAANGNTIYVAAADEGVLVLDATDPASITPLATIPTTGDAQGVTFANDVLYIAHTTSGVSSYDVSSPASPVLIDTHDSPGMAYEVVLYGTDYAYLADGYSVEAYSLTGAGIITSDPAVRPASFAINGNYPNPFNASTVLSFNLPAAGQVRVEVFDMMGRFVAKLYEGNLGIGEHKLHWNADAFTSGLYFAQVTSPLGQKVQKMVLLK